MNKKSLFHISKRDTLPWYTNVAIRGGAIILALVVCALVTTILTGENPLSIYGTILKGAFGTARKSWTTWENVAILLGISLAVTPAFKMRFWNIGAEGQVLIGCLASTTCMICLGGKMPNWLLLVVMTVASLAAGALWGFLPGFFKAKWNTNETLFTLMMNYIATQLVGGSQGLRQDRHHQPGHPGRLAAHHRQPEVPAGHSGGGHPHGPDVHLSELQQARL